MLKVMLLFVYFWVIDNDDASCEINKFLILSLILSLLDLYVWQWPSDIFASEPVNPVHFCEYVPLVVGINARLLAEHSFCECADPFNFGIVSFTI